MERWFSWRCADGRQIDWWRRHVENDPTRFVHNEWGKFAIAVDLNAREIQIQWVQKPLWQSLKFADVLDENERLALEAACDAREMRFASELFLRIMGHDDSADALRVLADKAGEQT